MHFFLGLISFSFVTFFWIHVRMWCLFCRTARHKRTCGSDWRNFGAKQTRSLYWFEISVHARYLQNILLLHFWVWNELCFTQSCLNNSFQGSASLCHLVDRKSQPRHLVPTGQVRTWWWCGTRLACLRLRRGASANPCRGCVFPWWNPGLFRVLLF